MAKRDSGSETILVAMSVFTFLLLAICPGMIIGFFLPLPAGLLVMAACGACGPWLLYWVDRVMYGPRDGGSNV